LKKNLYFAVEYYKKAIDQQYPRSLSNLARFYEIGQGGLPQDQQIAFEYYHLAANLGYVRAQYNLAICYENGRGTPPNVEEAVRFYRMAANANDQNISPHAKSQLERLMAENPHL